MDRNEVLLVGRLSAAVEEYSMPSGDTVTKWRIIVRRRRPHRRGVTLTDSIPCVTFNPETAAVLRGLKPRDYIEVTGFFRCRVFGPSAAKIWRYEVEVSTAKPVEAAAATLPEPDDDHPVADHPPADRLPAGHSTVDRLPAGHSARDQPPADQPPADLPSADRPTATVAALVPVQGSFLARAS
ncbi:single-stranded DNA-binding protein [Nonomuraea basaltis]|uniref:single-stranded DNA-binding protein n=1 Tax=Nonomuraea basaltis TaxID=2495887 RepID=UPI0014875A1F|nr:single-stranded DNA-binding protein [Nonomuraea basaltis]